MKKFLLSIIATGLIGSYAMADEPNTMVIHYNDGTTQSIQIDKIDYLDFITTADPGTGEQPPVTDITPKMFSFTSLSSTPTMIGQMNWQDVNNKIYGSQGLTAQTFWNNYNRQYQVTVAVATDGNGGTNTLYSGYGTEGSQFSISQDGIFCNVFFNANNTTTSQIEFLLDNKCKTDITYYNFEGKGAKYTVTIHLTPNNPKQNNPIDVIQTFYVKAPEKLYDFNDNFLVPGTGTNRETNPAVVQTKGVATTGGWVLEMDIAQAFVNELIGGSWVDIFQYYWQLRDNILQNPQIAFGFYDKPALATDVAYGPTSFPAHFVGLTAPLKNDKKSVPMYYEVTLANNEKFQYNFVVEFLNPFSAATPQSLTIYANDLGSLTADAATCVKVVESDNPNSVIYSYVSNALALSSRATDFFKLQPGQVTVEYSWNQTKGDWNSFANQLPEGSSLDLNPTTGVITYIASATLQVNRTLYVNATVTFGNICEVVVEIPVQFLAQTTPAK